MKRLIYKSLLPIMTVISAIACYPVHAESYQMGEPVTIKIEMTVTNIIDAPDVYCTEPNAPPVCLVVVEENAQVSPEPEVTQEP